MATTFDEDERSVSRNRPIDLYTITTPTVTYQLTSHVQDVTYGGATYTALTMSRSDLQVAENLNGQELVVYLPISHALVQRFASRGVPEREVQVTLLRLQEKSGQAQQQFSGFVVGMSCDANVAMLRAPSITDDAMKVRLPVVRAQRLCNHVLFDARCNPGDGPARAAFTVNTTIVSQTTAASGTTLVVASMGGQPSGWAAAAGEAIHTTTGERRQVLAQTGTTLTIDQPFFAATAGDAVAVSASCNHTVAQCRDKFANVANFGGHPEMTNSIDPWKPKGIGVIVQT
jgi:hypothetical protein